MFGPGEQHPRFVRGTNEPPTGAGYTCWMNEHELQGRQPLEIFKEWLGEAEVSEPNDPNAVALATSTTDGRPSVRMVLMKRADERGFCFYTNEGSEKGVQMHTNPHAAMCFHWKSLRRQVRVEGTISDMPGTEVDEYFHSRSRRSQLGAAVSQQSRPLASRAELEEAVRRFGAEHPEEIPRPEFWRGYCLSPERVEFWMDGKDRLHDRFLFTRADGGWSVERLYP